MWAVGRVGDTGGRRAAVGRGRMCAQDGEGCSKVQTRQGSCERADGASIYICIRTASTEALGLSEPSLELPPNSVIGGG
jgi:hypothetical protein